jgi:hypothetical protein
MINLEGLAEEARCEDAIYLQRNYSKISDSLKILKTSLSSLPLDYGATISLEM